MKFSKRNRGFTLAELVVLIAILGILIALLLPAIAAARAAARRASSMNNMKQLGIATLTFEEANKTFPALYFKNYADRKDVKEDDFDPTQVEPHYSWIVRILPYIEERAVYDAISEPSEKFTLSPDKIKMKDVKGNEMAPPDQLSMAVLRSPAAPNVTPGITNYVALSATKQQLLTIGKEAKQTLAEGIVIPSSSSKSFKGVGMGAIRDGLSKTFLFTESQETKNSNWYHWQQTFVCGFLPGDTSVEKNDPKTGIPRYDATAEEDKQWTYNEKAGDRTALNYGPSAADPKAAYNNIAKDPLNRTWGPSSAHVGGVIHCISDGSVRFVVNGIESKVYYTSITRNGGEALNFDE